MSAVVIGVGNQFRHDDGAGLAVAERVRELELPNVSVVASDGEATRLLDCWADKHLAIVVDAAWSDTEDPGTVRRADAPGAGGSRPVSSHGLDLADAWSLGGVLGRRPERLVVYGIVGERFDRGTGLSSMVARAVEEVVTAVVDDLG